MEKGTCKGEEALNIFFANITTMGQKAQDYLLPPKMLKEFHMWGVVEHHLDKAAFVNIRKGIGKAGFICTANLATVTEAGGTTGGGSSLLPEKIWP